MSAEVAALNCKGVAIAADSAIIRRFSAAATKKVILDTANKIFALSDYNPVGIMISGTDEYMGINFELILNGYRKALGKKSFKTLDGYAKDFVKYLSESKYVTVARQIGALVDKIGTIVDEMHKEKLLRIKNEFSEYIQNYKKTNYIRPVASAIRHYNKAELADLAETIVKMAVLKKHIFNGSTAGPVDVAVMTKLD